MRRVFSAIGRLLMPRRMIVAVTALLFLFTTFAGAADEHLVRYLYYKKFFIQGHVGADYDYRKREFKNTEESGDRYNFYLRTNLKSYIYNPKLLIYDVGVYYRGSEGDREDDTIKQYTLNLDLFSTRPFTAKLRASYSDYENSDTLRYGMSLMYVRKRPQLKFASMRDFTRYNRNQRKKMKNNQNNQNNINRRNNNNNNNNDNDDNDKDLNQQNNQQLNHLAPVKPMRGNFFSRILPFVFMLDVDRYESDNDAPDPDSDGYTASFRLKGDYDTARTRTGYFGGVTYYEDSTDSATGDIKDKEVRSDLGTVTHFGRLNQLRMRVDYDYEDHDVYGDYYSWIYNGSFDGYTESRTWNYRLDGKYYKIDDTDDQERYDIRGSVGAGRKFGRVSTSFRVGGSFQHDNDIEDDNYSGFANANAHMRASQKVSLQSDVHVNAGTESTEYGFRIGGNYYHSRRLILDGSYEFQTQDGDFAEKYTGDAWSGQTLHRYMLGARSRWDNLNLNSNLTYSVFNDGDSLIWDNTAHTVLFYKVDFTLGLNVAYEDGRKISITEDPAGDDVTKVSAYNVISFVPWYNSIFRLYSRYTSVSNGIDEETYLVNPTLTWRIRRLFISAEYEYERTDFTSGAEITDQRYTLKLYRPFWI